MKERPILFSGPMVNAILAGRKTQTRRVMKPQIEHIHNGVHAFKRARGSVDYVRYHGAPPFCPYGGPGDRLWVRENWRVSESHDHIKPSEIDPATRVVYETEGHLCFGKLRPSLFMTRWASRITLEIMGVVCERLQECSPEDSLAEGATAGVPYGTIWKKINTAPGITWEDNPWVWVIKFKRVK